MYAPKFISGMTDEERFHSALEVRIAPMLEAMRVECKQMLVKAEEDLRLRPTNGQIILQMKYNAIADQLIQRNRNDQMSFWYSTQQNLGANPLSAFGAAFGSPYAAPNNWGLFS